MLELLDPKQPNTSGPPILSAYYLTVGSGHQMAALSVAQALNAENPEVTVFVTDPLSQAVEILPSILERMQAASIALTPVIYDALCRRGGRMLLFEWIRDLEVLQELLKENLNETHSNVVLATHVVPCILALSLKKNGILSKVFAIVTDFGLHTLWPVQEIDGYFVGHEELRQTLIYRGADPAKIFVTGIPIRPAYNSLADRASQHRRETLRILFLAGGIRSGAYVDVQQNIFEILDGIQKLSSRHVQVTLIAGKQEKLQRKVEEYGQQHPELGLIVKGFVDNMHEFMHSHDIVITKPGGLTMSEILACGACSILLKASPGQENANAEFMARHGVALRGETPDEVVNAIERCMQEPGLLEAMRKRARKLGSPNSSFLVARQILDQIRDIG